jgi:spore coat protein A
MLGSAENPAPEKLAARANGGRERVAGVEVERRKFLRLAGTVGAFIALPQVAFQATARAATRLSGVGYAPKFTQQLRRPRRVLLTPKRNSITIDVAQFTQQVLTGYPATTLYGYGVAGTKPSWPGPTLNASANHTSHVTWRNKLPKGRMKLSNGGHLLPVDASLLDAAMTALPPGEKPIVTHLHGAHAEWESDGHAEAWSTQNNHRGKFWKKSKHSYDNSQVGGTLWYHDHAHGITRLNVFAGMAGAYLLHDATEAALVAHHVLPDGAFEREIILQDRAFTDDGQLFLPTASGSASSIDQAFYGDFMMANGVPWPVLDVEPRKYRFRFVNGADSRFYVLRLSSGAKMIVVGTDLSLLRKAVSVAKLPISPGERYDVVIDFTGMTRGTAVFLQNLSVDGGFLGFAATDGTITNRPSDSAFGFGPATDPASTAQVMMFRVSKKLSKGKNASVRSGTAIGPKLPKLTATKTRQVIAFAGTDQQGRTMEMLGTLGGGTKEWMDPVTEVIRKGTTEIWDIYNAGLVAHPIHLHLVNFHVLDRAPIAYNSTPKAMMDGTGAVVTVTAKGATRPSEPYERGRKDTVICYPGEVTRIIANFDRAGNYMWHCHILHHEDHDMMRPITIR